MIASFRDRHTRRLFGRVPGGRWGDAVERAALRKLRMLDAATGLEDLRAPPANRLEKLGGDRAGQWSIRVNAQWRVCFRWEAGMGHDVELVDYH